jgi:amidase
MMPDMKNLVSGTALALAIATLSLSAQTKRAAAPAARKPFTFVEATIPEMRTAMEQGRITSRDLVQQYLVRIAT